MPGYRKSTYRKRSAPYKKRAPYRKKAPYKRRRVAPAASIARVAKAVTLSLRTMKLNEETIVSMPFGVGPLLTVNAARTAYDATQPRASGLEADGVTTYEPDMTWTLTAANHWTVHQPLYIEGTTNQDHMSMREDNKIYARNTSVQWDLKVDRKIAQCFRMRIIHGYYLGDSHTAENGLGHLQMNSLFPRWNSQINTAGGLKKPFRITSDTVRVYTPHQVYDANWSDDQESVSEVVFGQESRFAIEGNETTNGLWRPITGKFNLKYDKVFTYATDRPSSLMGANPFVAYGIFPCDEDFKTVDSGEYGLNQAGTGATPVGINSFDEEGNVRLNQLSAADTNMPSPELRVTYQSYFSDVK